MMRAKNAFCWQKAIAGAVILSFESGREVEERLPNSAGPFSKSEFARAGLLALAGFVVCASVIHSALGDPFRLYAALRTEQLVVMDRLRDSSFSAAFGSSHVHNAFDPAAFDRQLQGTPLATHTVNLAIPGGSQVEQRATALEFLGGLHAPRSSPNGPKSCMVLLELSAGANMGTMFMVHPRTINMYDWRGVRLVAGLTGRQMGMKRSLGRVGFAVAASAMYYMNVGMLSNRIFRPGMNYETLNAALANDRRGAELMASVPRYLSSMQRIIGSARKAPQPVPADLLPGNYALVDELRTAARVHPLQFAYIELPLLANLTSYPVYPDHLQSAGGAVPIVNLARPDLHPELYQLQYWHDDAHLNQQGAELATAMIANDLKSWYAAHGWPSACEE